jgi:hypothetical protein
MCGKYLRVFGEYAECIKAFKENMANWGYLRYTKLSPNTRKVFKNIFGENVERIYSYMEKMKRDSWRILCNVQQMTFVVSFYDLF